MSQEMSNIKEQIRQEMDTRRQHMVEELMGHEENCEYHRIKGMHDAYVDLLTFLDYSLPEETSCIYDTNGLTPTPSVNIEDVARVQFASHAHVFDCKRKAVFDWEQFKEVAGIFYGFGKRDSLPEETCKDSLQVPETCKENTDSFTSLEEAADEYADDNFVQWVEDDEIYSDADKIRETFIAEAKWQANN